MKRLGRRVILILVGQLGGVPLGLLVGGFLFCFRRISDVHPGSLGVLEKVGASLMYALFTLITFGFPWTSEAGTAHENVWPLAGPISVCFGVVIYLVIAMLAREKRRPNQPPEPTAMSVTPRACARVAPATTVAHL